MTRAHSALVQHMRSRCWEVVSPAAAMACSASVQSGDILLGEPARLASHVCKFDFKTSRIRARSCVCAQVCRPGDRSHHGHALIGPDACSSPSPMHRDGYRLRTVLITRNAATFEQRPMHCCGRNSLCECSTECSRMPASGRAHLQVTHE